MFALFAVGCFILAAFHVGHVWIFDTVVLGLLFIAVHLWVGGGISLPWRRQQ